MTWGAVAAGGAALTANYLGGQSNKDANQAAIDAAYLQYKQGREDLGPYREFGYGELEDYQNWLASPEGGYRPTPEDIAASPGYETRLGAIENSAIARGGLFSGNALRDVGEFGAAEYDREIARRNTERASRMANINIGYGAAGGSAGLAQDYGRQAADLYSRGGQSQADMWGNIGGAVAGAAGAYQGQQDWNAFLDRAYPVK